MLIGSLSDKAGAADTKAQSAIEKSSLAENKASDAGAAAVEAKHKADAVAKQADELMRKLNEAGQNLLVTQALVSARQLQNIDSLIWAVKTIQRAMLAWTFIKQRSRLQFWTQSTSW